MRMFFLHFPKGVKDSLFALNSNPQFPICLCISRVIEILNRASIPSGEAIVNSITLR